MNLMSSGLSLYVLDDGGADHWIVARDESDARMILHRDFFEVCGVTPPPDIGCSVETGAALRFDVDDGAGPVQRSASEWVDWASEPQYLACSDF